MFSYLQAGAMISPMVLVVLISLLTQSCGTEYTVGDSFWSIPTTNDFYNNWSSSHFFKIGDTLYFDFDSGLHDVMQVSTREYEGCSSDHPFEAFRDGPARIVLMEEGVFYFICSTANYCALGQKFTIVVHRENNCPNFSPEPSHSYPLSSSSSESDWYPMPPRGDIPFSSQAPNGKVMDWSMSVVGGLRSGGDQCYHGPAPLGLGWFAAFYIVFYFILG